MSTSPITSQCRDSGDLGTMLRCFRERRFWTQAALAEKAGLPEKTISSLETGTRRRPHLTTLRLLADALELDADDQAAFISQRDGGGVAAVAQTVSVAQTQLPLPATSFLGREDLVLRLQGMFAHPENRLLTLTGIGGIGKTRLALRVSEGLAGTIADGVFVVDFTGINDPGLVPATIAQGLGVQPSTGRAIEDAVIDYCATRRMVLVLDNFEHVVSAARFVDRLIAGSSHLAVLVTSRERLALKRERLVSVRPLTLPSPPQPGETTTIAVAMESEAVQLFVERAQAVQPTFEITEANVDDIAEICRRLDGIPLAIELAAARIPHVGSPSYLRQRLHQSLSWLTTNLRDQTDRHRTMRAAIDWSYEALEPFEQAIFRQLSVFAGGFTIDAVEGLGVRGWGLGTSQEIGNRGHGTEEASFPSPSVLDGIASLVERNLVQLYDGPDGGTRYRLLEMIREYGLEKLKQSGEEVPVRTAHAETYLAMAERGETELSGPNNAGWVARLKTEQDNLRAAIEFLIASNNAERSLRLGSSLWRFWAVTGRVEEGGNYLQRAVALDGPLPEGLRAKALRRLGNMAVDQADFRAARAYFAASLELARQGVNLSPIADALGSLGLIAFNLGDYENARAYLEEALSIGQTQSDKHKRAVLLQLLGWVAFASDQFQEAEQNYRASLQLRRQQDDVLGAAYATVWLGQLARFRGRWVEAETWLGESLTSFRLSGDRSGEGHALFELAMLNHARANETGAITLLHQSLTLRRELSDLQSTIEALEGSALLLLDLGHGGDSENGSEGVKLFASAAEWRTEQGIVCHPPLQRRFASALDRTRQIIGESAFDTAWRLGQATVIVDAVAMALDCLVRQGNALGVTFPD